MEYYLGLDLGTNSVGWAVTDENYRLIRKKGKDLWGVREFERAETTAVRRIARINRRRLQREQVRIGLLKTYFADAIEELDPSFLSRLDNSRLYPEDKKDGLGKKCGIFCDPDYTDADYYREYPTIFHLRKELIYNTEKHDVRLVFLALLNMFKHRGHFLNAGLSSEDSELDGIETYNMLSDTLNHDYKIEIPLSCGEQTQSILFDNTISRTKKVEKIAELWNISKKNKKEYECIKLLCGLKANLTLIFTEQDDSNKDEKIEICFSNNDIEDKIQELSEKLGDNVFEVVNNFRDLYSLSILNSILQGKKYLSDARCESFLKHKNDLLCLKAAYKSHTDKDTYLKMFRGTEKGSYSAYVNSTNSGKKQRRNMDDRDLEALYIRIKKDLKKELALTDSDVSYIYQELEKQTFFPKQLTANNGVIPNQLHLKEMKKILQNAEGYLPFLSEKDERGLSVSEKIVQLFQYQIPYYIGPTSDRSEKDGGNGWVVRKENGQVLPWNIEEKIDITSTAHAFIERMLRNCTYITGEKAMPKSSLMYEAYCVLNEINNITIDGERIDPKLKQSLYLDMYMSGKRVTRKSLENYLKGHGVDISHLAGIDTNLNNYLPTYGKFVDILGEDLKRDCYREMAEDIIYIGTIFGESKKMFRKQVEEKYGNILTQEQIKKILRLKFKDWGRFSKTFLEMKGCDKTTGEELSIIRALWETDKNLNELLFSKQFTFNEELASLEKKTLGDISKISFEDLDDYYFSNPVKRMIWQTLMIIKDVRKVMGENPARVFIEMTREEQEKGEKGRTNSRKRQLVDLYKNIDDENRNWIQEIEKADENGALRSKKIYLYYKQRGKCMYTGEEIDFENLLQANSQYDIDHIYPRHFVKDDNIENNLVLVKKEYNQRVKGDLYPVPEAIRNNPKVRELWMGLSEQKLITVEKYRRLTNNNPFTDEQRAGFIARQLVETSQGMKGVADILKQALPKTQIVYSKASNVSDFRRDRCLMKSRIVNEFHHAQDAYLNIVVGNAYFTKFTMNPLNFIKDEYNLDRVKNDYHLNKMFEMDIVRNGYAAWRSSRKGDPGTIKVVREMLEKNTPIVTKMNHEERGQLYNLTIYGKEKAKENNYVPLKKDLPVRKYGGYTSLKPAYFIFVEHGNEKKRQKCFEVIHSYYTASIKTEENLIKHCETVLGLENPRIIASKINKNALIKMDGYFLYIEGMDSRKNVEFHNAVNMCLSQKKINYIHDMEKSVEKQILKNTITKEKNILFYEELIDKHQHSIFKNNPKPIGDVLEKGKTVFEGFSELKQCEYLVKLLKITGIGAQSVDIKEIGGRTDAGRIRISGNMTKRRELLLITQSASGLFENTKDLLQS